MDEQVTISTPEQVAFQYEMAGIGSRFLASLLDHLILGTVLSLVYCGVLAVASAGAVTFTEQAEATVYIAIAILVLIVFLIFWGYFVLFETIWNGQTPGKRAGRLRVIRRSGQPISAGEAMIRNLVRLVDLLPGFYGIGLITMFADKQTRRLGDFAAGTIVIREGEQTRLQDVRVPQPAPSPSYAHPGNSPQTTYSQHPYNAYTAHNPQIAAPTRPDPLPGISLRDITHEDYRLAREMLARVRRGEMPRDRAYDLATRLAHGIAARMGHNFTEWQQRGWDPVVFLESLLIAQEVRGQ